MTGHSPPVIDTLFAATALEYDLYLVTRNVRDAQISGAQIFDPWNDDPGPNFLDSSAAEAVITLNVEPGMKSPALARLRRGAAGVQLAVMVAMRP